MAEQDIDLAQPEFGLRLRALRLDKGMAQRDLAGSRITAGYVSLIESGKRIPTLNVVLLLAHELDVPVGVLLGRPSEQLIPQRKSGDDLASTFLRAVNSLETGDHEAALVLLQKAYREALPNEDGHHLAQIAHTLNNVLQVLKRYEERVALFREMLTLPGIDQRPVPRVFALSGLASALRDSGAFHEAKEIALKARTLVEAPRFKGGVEHIKILGILVSVLCEIDAVHEIPSPLRELIELSREFGHKGVIGRSNWVASRAYAIIGDREAAYASLQVALKHLSLHDMSTREWIRFSRSTAATLLTIERDLPLAERWLANAESSSDMLGADEEKPPIQVLKARYKLLCGEPEEVVAIHRELSREAVVLPERLRAKLQEALSEAYFQLGETTEGVQALRDCARSWEEAGDFQRAVTAWKRIDQATKGDDAKGRQGS